MIELDGYTGSIEIAGMECRYDPERSMALIYCENCGNQEEVEVFHQGEQCLIYGFMCSQCGHFNQPCG